ncbi:2-hydroxychromene-2-carboxylate isomerase [Polaromonas sp. CF318]|uniref:2-hydroxychromene-2-carboxylate isomerase n=1 Tax=Polaromonas sp. CF318 TaxID=1144318 RepID=UPI000270DAEF|nr:DsbA family protein [Polaromonas sp. CF318]EJL87113.1 2-hydroxychromene-2-carboxylate isomerase [Polaromonas sp. CF318]
MKKAQWYFDLISPFSYLHFHKLRPLRDHMEIQAVPVLFAGLLKHWGTKGPAEVPPKRLHTYQYCVWAAGQQGLPFQMPPRHPFNPLPAQRLMVALGATDQVVKDAFHFIYGEGRDPELEFDALAERLEASDAGTLVGSPEVKQQLAANTQRAVGAGVFGVPTLAIGERLFWGSDTADWAGQYLEHPDLFQRPEYEAVAKSEFGVTRT